MAEREMYFADLSKKLRHKWFEEFERASENGKQIVKIPYEVDQSMGNEWETIRQAMDTIHNHSRVRFVRRETERCYLNITKVKGCYYFGSGSGSCLTTISLGEGCKHYGIVLHELLHALGFQHEHQRPDRDEFVIIYEENIREERSQFKKFQPEEYRWHDFNFDYSSNMLYYSYAFSKASIFPTITKKNDGIINKNINLSEDDIQKLRTLDGTDMMADESSCTCL